MRKATARTSSAPALVDPAHFVTMQDIAVRCGVHRSTVQRALTGSERVKSKTAEQILAIAREMGYDEIVHHNSRRLAWRKHGKTFINYTLALFFPPDFSRNPYYLQMFQGILDVLVPSHYDLLTTYQSEEEEEKLPFGILCGNVDGVIVIGDEKALTTLRDQLRATPNFANRPLVSLVLPFPGYSAVLADGRGGSYQTVSHLLDLGHRYILHFWENAKKREPEYHTQERLSGYRLAYRERGLDPDKYLIGVTVDYDLPRSEWATTPLREELRKNPRITAIVSMNDLFALEIYTALQRDGVRVPQEMSLVGFDDVETIPHEETRDNILTTVRMPQEEIGREAARMLIRQVEGDTTTPAATILPTTLVVRRTTAPPR